MYVHNYFFLQKHYVTLHNSIRVYIQKKIGGNSRGKL